MNLSIIHTHANIGVQAPPVQVEVHLANGLPQLAIVGLAETAVKESKERVRSAIINSQFKFPTNYRITVNLAPADLPKAGGRFDLPIAIGILAASGQINNDQLNQFIFAGELALSGELRHIKALLPVAIACKNSGKTLIIPKQNEQEVACSGYPDILVATTLIDVCNHLMDIQTLPKANIKPSPNHFNQQHNCPDLADVKGQSQAKRALEIAASGSHNLRFNGPPGTGKSMLSQRLPSILPPLTTEQSLEVAAIYSVAGIPYPIVKQPPFRQVHHSASKIAIIGGGNSNQLMPGEISLAHHGVIFFDEIAEFPRSVIEALREPIENNSITISRAAMKVEYACNFSLVISNNPCPCGFYGDRVRRCSCSELQIQRYQQKLSGPILDRIDLHLYVHRPSEDVMFSEQQEESSEVVRQRVINTRQIQIKRQGYGNAKLAGRYLQQYAPLTTQQQQFLQQAMSKLSLSPRAIHRIIRVARTLADMEQSEQIQQHHLVETLSYRQG